MEEEDQYDGAVRSPFADQQADEVANSENDSSNYGSPNSKRKQSIKTTPAQSGSPRRDGFQALDVEEESASERPRANSQQSAGTKFSKGFLPSVVPPSVLVAVMPWMEEERPLLPHQEAAILLEFARDGQDLNGSKLTLRSRLCYRLRHKYHWFFRAAAWGLVLIHIFERPVWTYRAQHVANWNDYHIFPSWELSYLDGATANALVFVCLVFNWLGVGLELGYKQNTANVYLPWTALVILAIKTTVNIAKLALIAQGRNPTFGVSPIEGFLCVLVELQHDNNVGFLLRSIPKFMVLMVGMAVFVLIYTTLGMLIFNPESDEGQEVFTNFGIALWNMAMVLNGANWPGPMVPALVTNRIFVLYFYVFLILVVWGLLNIVLGFNYLFFQQEQQAIAEMQEKTRVDNKAAAFRILDVENNGFLTYGQVDELLLEMYTYYEELTSLPTAAERYELILALDIQSNLLIDENDFSFIEQKCFQGALKAMRSRKRKFMRFISANMIREQGAQILKKQADKLKIVSLAAVGVRLPDSDHGNASGIIPDRDLDGTADEESSLRDSQRILPQDSMVSSASHKTTFGESELAAETRRALEVKQAEEEEAERVNRHGLIEKAAAYASKYVDPKVLAWYKSVGDSHIVAMSRERSRTFSKLASHFAMQVDSVYFDIMSDTIIVGVGIALLMHQASKDFTITYNVLTLSEMFLKLYVKGYHRYVSSNRSAIDGKIAVSLLILTILDAAVPGRSHSHIIIKTFVLLRTLLYPRNIIVTNGFKNFRNRQRLAFQYAFGSVDHFSFLLLVLVVMMYIFAGIGQQIFGGTINRHSQRVAGSSYADLAFWPLNFNDMPSGMVTMFTLLSVNDMNVTTSGFTAALSQWAEVFFILWYCLGVLFFLNVLTAVFLNQFIGYLGQLAVEREKEAERVKEKEAADAAAAVIPEIEYYVPVEEPLAETPVKDSKDSTRTDSGRGWSKKKRDAPAVLEEDTPHVPEGPVPSWYGDRVPFSDPEQNGPADLPPSWGEEQHEVAPAPGPESSRGGKMKGSKRASITSTLADVTQKTTSILGEATAKTGALLTDATLKTGALLTDATLKTGALLTDATVNVTVKTTELVQTSRTGLSTFVQMLVVDDSAGFAQQAAGAVPAERRPSATPHQEDVMNPLTSSPRRASSATNFSRATSRRQSTASISFSSPIGMKSVANRRTSGFIALRDHAPEEADLEEDDDNAELEAIQEEEDEAAPITEQKGFTPSIFVSNDERAKLNEWVLSQYKRKRRPGRSRRDSASISSGTRSRTNTGQWDTSFHPIGGVHPESRARAGSKATSAHSDDSEGRKHAAGVFTPPGRKRTISSERGDTYNVLLSAAASGHMDSASPTAEGEDAHSRSVRSMAEDDQPGGIQMTTLNAAALESLRQIEKEALQREDAKAVDYSQQTWEEWFYQPDQLSRYEEAAVLIQAALDGEDPELFTSRRALWCFHTRVRYAFYFKAAAVLYSFLKFFQRPAWTYSEPHWNNADYFPVSGMPQWSPYVTGSLKIPLLLVIMFGMLLEVGYQEATFYGMVLRKHSWMGVARHLLQMYAIVQFCLVIYSLSGGPKELVAYSSCGSMLYVMWFVRRSLKKLYMVAQVVPRLAQVMVLYLLILCLFSGFGPFLYNIENVGADDDVAPEYFPDFRTSTWSIFVALTSSSYPCQIMPAYRQYREFSLFFFLFITIGAFCMLNLIVAIVFVEFQKASQLSADYQRAIRQVLLMRAFDVLDDNESDSIDTTQLALVVNELKSSFQSFARRLKTPEIRKILVDSLDTNSNGQILMQDFLGFLDASRSKLPFVQTATFMELWFPSVVKTAYFGILRKMIMYPYTNLIFDCTIAVFTVTNLAVNSGNLYRVTPSSVALGAVQMVIMVIEMTAKMMVRGYSTYRRSFRNQLDSTITIGAFIAVLGAIGYRGVSFFTLMRRVLLIFRLFWLPRNLRYVFESKGIKKFAKLCWRIVGKTMTLGVVFLCILYAFAAIGTFAFGGLINRDPNGPHYDALMSSRYASDGYFPLNFNDFMSSLITVFCCLHVSDFDVIAEGMVVTSAPSARLYFGMWYVVGVLLMLNILKSFFLDEFLAVFSATAAEDTVAVKDDRDAEDGEVAKIGAAFSSEEGGDADMEGHVMNPLVETPVKETRPAPVLRSIDVALDPLTTTEPYVADKYRVDVSCGSVLTPAVVPAVQPAPAFAPAEAKVPSVAAPATPAKANIAPEAPKITPKLPPPEAAPPVAPKSAPLDAPSVAAYVAAPPAAPVVAPAAASAKGKASGKKNKGPVKTPKLPPPAVAPPAPPVAEVPSYAPPPPPPLPSLPPPSLPPPPLPHYMPASVATGPHLLYGLEEVDEEEVVTPVSGALEDEKEGPEGLLQAPTVADIEDGYVNVYSDGNYPTEPVPMDTDAQEE